MKVERYCKQKETDEDNEEDAYVAPTNNKGSNDDDRKGSDAWKYR